MDSWKTNGLFSTFPFDEISTITAIAGRKLGVRQSFFFMSLLSIIDSVLQITRF